MSILFNVAIYEPHVKCVNSLQCCYLWTSCSVCQFSSMLLFMNLMLSVSILFNVAIYEPHVKYQFSSILLFMNLMLSVSILFNVAIYDPHVKCQFSSTLLFMNLILILYRLSLFRNVSANERLHKLTLPLNFFLMDIFSSAINRWKAGVLYEFIINNLSYDHSWPDPCPTFTKFDPWLMCVSRHYKIV